MKHPSHLCLYLIFIYCSLVAMDDGTEQTHKDPLQAVMQHQQTKEKCITLNISSKNKNGKISLSQRPPTPIPPFLRTPSNLSLEDIESESASPSYHLHSSPISRRWQLIERALEECKTVKKQHDTDAEHDTTNRSPHDLKRTCLLARAASGSKTDLLAYLEQEDMRPGPECWPHNP